MDKAEFAPEHHRRLGVSAGTTWYVVVAFTAFLLILLWSTIFYQLDRDKMALFAAARTNSDNLARAYSEHVVGTLRLLDQMLLRLKIEYEKTSSIPDLARSLHDASNLNAGAALVGIIDQDGYLLASTKPLPPSARFVGDRDYFVAHSKNEHDQLYISKPMTGRITGKRVIIALSRGLKNASGRFGGVIFVSFDPEYLSGFFSDLTIGRNSTFAVIGRDLIIRDMVRGSGRDAEAIGKSLAQSPLVPALAQSPNGNYAGIGVLDGRSRIYSYRSVSDYPLVVVSSVAEDDVLAEFRRREAWLMGVAVVLSVIFVGVAVWQLHQLSSRKADEVELSRRRGHLALAQRITAIGSFDNDLLANTVEWSDQLY
jgi:hypothetical protein